ncbi:hypothetical protein PMZ80_004520 [Knufia obscura]|uniref:Phytanoyl-CoA dioxygenase n=1 Tax=Knufia obscura TaxID=1635080 RepID=A0ABR0RSC1_9EURO|nr:hypothetical protein PMZ80_004520 [Knufia obscura]
MAPFLSEDTDSTPRMPGKGSKYVDGALIPDVEQHGDNPVAIRLTDEELHSGRTRPETIQQCLKYLHRDGLVVLENAIDEALVDKLYKKIVEDNEIYLSKNFLQYNQGIATKNVSQVPPLTPEWLSRDFYANVHMMRVIENMLGPRPELRFINSNVAVPGATGRQAVHSDVNHRFPEIPFGIVMNIYLQDSDASNGVTEIWCGTHDCYPQEEQQATKESGWIKKEAIQKRAKVKPPVQPKLKKGSICFRDLRLWHAGMPNTSDHHRIMLAIDYFAEWYQCPMTVELPRAMKKEIEEEWNISTKGVKWVDKVDHLNQPFYLNMTQDPSMYIRQTEKGVEDWRARLTGKFEFDRAKVTDQNYWTAE